MAHALYSCLILMVLADESLQPFQKAFRPCAPLLFAWQLLHALCCQIMLSAGQV